MSLGCQSQRITMLLCLSLAAGCSNNPFALQHQNQTLNNKSAALETRNRDLESRASSLDQDNQELHAQIAQTKQTNRLLEDQLSAVKDQLSNTTQQLAEIRNEKQVIDKQVEALNASTKRRGGAMITANNSLRRSLPAVNVPGLEVRQDGDVIRIELPVSRLFGGGTALQQSALSLIDSAAAEIVRACPDQTIGIEGHTDNESAVAVQQHQTSINRAMAVYQYVSSRGQLQPGQLFVVGHGGNHPVVSNATPQGRDRNNRIELVIYPERRQQ